MKLAYWVLCASIAAVACATSVADEKASKELARHGLRAGPSPDLPGLLPATVPGPSSAHVHLLRGSLRALPAGDDSQIAPVSPIYFPQWAPTPKDVFDSITQAGTRYFVVIRAIDAGSGWVREGAPGYGPLARGLAGKISGYETWTVEFAFIGNERKAATLVTPAAQAQARRRNVSSRKASGAEWTLRRSTENAYFDALKREGLPAELTGRLDLRKLLGVARSMRMRVFAGARADEAWAKVIHVLEPARRLLLADTPRDVRARVMQDLASALGATGETSRQLALLSEHARADPQSSSAWIGLARFYLHVLALPEHALAFAQKAHALAPTSTSCITLAAALSRLGRDDEAMRALRPYVAHMSERIRTAEAHLRLGALDKASELAEGALKLNRRMGRALNLRGCVAYARGSLDRARAAFEEAAAADWAMDARGMAAYNLGLTCLRLQQGRAARQAFEASRTAIQNGAPRETDAGERALPEFGLLLTRILSGQPAGDVRDALMQATSSALPHTLLARHFRRRGNLAGAMAVVRTGLSREPGSAIAQSLAAGLWTEQARHLVRANAPPATVGALVREALQLAHRAKDAGLADAGMSQLIARRAASMGAAPRGAKHLPPHVADADTRAARALLARAVELRTRHPLLAAVYARAVVARFAEHEGENAHVEACVTKARAVDAALGADPQLQSRLPPSPR